MYPEALQGADRIAHDAVFLGDPPHAVGADGFRLHGFAVLRVVQRCSQLVNIRKQAVDDHVIVRFEGGDVRIADGWRVCSVAG